MTKLLTSLQRLYDLNDGDVSDAVTVPATSGTAFPRGDRDCDLSASLLEAVFEISDFDPLPQLIRKDGEFGGAASERWHDGAVENRHRHAAPANGSVYSNPLPRSRQETLKPVSPIAAGSGHDRRKLPRRESDCQVAVCLCKTEERMTAERIAWLLHATQLKGSLIDVSMSGISFSMSDPLPADAKILLRIKNYTIDQHVDAAAIVLRSSEAAEGDWNVVCRFHKNLTFEQIHVVGRSLFAATIV